MPNFDEWLDEYGRYHQDAVNRAAHLIAFPLILGGGFALLGRVHALAFIAVFAAFAIGNALVAPLAGSLVSIFAYGVKIMAEGQRTTTLVVLVVVGVAVGIVGHVVFEKRWPDSRARLLRFELVGHVWFMQRILGRRP